MRFQDLPQTWQKALGGKGEVAVWLEFEVAGRTTDRVADVSGIAEGYSVGADWNRRVSFTDAVVELYRDDDLLPSTAGSMLHEAVGTLVEAISAGATSVRILAESISFTAGQQLTLCGGDKSEVVTVASFTRGNLYHTITLSAGTTNAYPINAKISTPPLLGSDAQLRLRADGENSFISLYRGVIAARPEVSADRIYIKLGGKWETAFRAYAKLLDTNQKFLTINGNGKATSSVKISNAQGEFDISKVEQKSSGRHGQWRVNFTSGSEYEITGPSIVLRGQKFYLPRPAQVGMITGRTGARHITHYQNYIYIIENATSRSGRVSVWQLGTDGSLTWIGDVTASYIQYDDLYDCYVAGTKLYVIQHNYEEFGAGIMMRFGLTDPSNPSYEDLRYDIPHELFGGCDYADGQLAMEHSDTYDYIIDMWQGRAVLNNGQQGFIRRRSTQLYLGHSGKLQIRSWQYPWDITKEISVSGGTWDWDFTGNIGLCTSPGSNRVLAVDLTNPANASIIGEASSELSTPLGLAVLGQFLLVASSGNNKIVVFDISDPTEMSLVATYDMGTEPYDVHSVGDFAIAVSIGGSVVTFKLVGGTEFSDETLTLPRAAFKGSWRNSSEASFVTSRVWENENIVKVLHDVVTAAGVKGKALDASSFWGNVELGTLSQDVASRATKISVNVDRWWRLPVNDTLVIGTEEVTISANSFSLPPVFEISISALSTAHNAGETVKWKQRQSPWTTASWDRAYQFAELSRLKVSMSIESERTYDDILADVLRHGNMALAEDGFGVMRLWPWAPAAVDAESLSASNIAAMSEDAESVPVIDMWRGDWAKGNWGNQWQAEVKATDGPEQETVDFAAFYSELPVMTELQRRAVIFRGARVRRVDCTFARCYLAPGDFVSGVDGIVTKVSLSPARARAELEVWEYPDIALYAYAGQSGAGYRRTW